MGNISLKYDSKLHRTAGVKNKPAIPAHTELPLPEIYSNKRRKRDYYKLELKEEQSTELNTHRFAMRLVSHNKILSVNGFNIVDLIYFFCPFPDKIL